MRPPFLAPSGTGRGADVQLSLVLQRNCVFGAPDTSHRARVSAQGTRRGSARPPIGTRRPRDRSMTSGVPARFLRPPCTRSSQMRRGRTRNLRGTSRRSSWPRDSRTRSSPAPRRIPSLSPAMPAATSARREGCPRPRLGTSRRPCSRPCRATIAAARRRDRRVRTARHSPTLAGREQGPTEDRRNRRSGGRIVAHGRRGSTRRCRRARSRRN